MALQTGTDRSAANANAITLSDERIAWSSGDGLTLETMRLNTAAVAAWCWGALPRRLRHTGVSTTERFYGHDDLSDLAQAMEQFAPSRDADPN